MDKRVILVIDPYCQNHIDKMALAVGEDFVVKQLNPNYSKEELISGLKEAEIVVGAPELRLLHNQEDCPRLRFIQMSWAGTDMYTRSKLPFPVDRIQLANGSGAYGLIMSQFVVGMILSCMLNFMDYHRQQELEVWERKGPIKSLDHAKVLIFGAGDIGSAVAKRLSGFNTYNIGVCRNTNKAREFFDELCTLEDAEKYLSEVDVVVGCIPNTEETAGYLNASRLHQIKEGAVVVNVGRGNLIDCIALDKELTSRHLWGAALDVTSPEPLPLNHPLWKNPYCMITPHCSGASFGFLKETEDLLCELICENLKRYCNNEMINNKVY